MSSLLVVLRTEYDLSSGQFAVDQTKQLFSRRRCTQPVPLLFTFQSMMLRLPQGQNMSQMPLSGMMMQNILVL
jgi:hypothetical protein